MFSLPCTMKTVLMSAISTVSEEFCGGKDLRSRKLPIEKILCLMIGAEGGSLAKELHRARISATPAAVSQRRAQIPPQVFQRVFSRFNSGCPDRETFRGYRILAVDGTAINIPRNPSAPSFVYNDSKILTCLCTVPKMGGAFLKCPTISDGLIAEEIQGSYQRKSTRVQKDIKIETPYFPRPILQGEDMEQGAIKLC